MKRQTTIVFPKEHGAYIVLICGWLFGVIYAPTVDLLAFGCSIAVSASLFLLQEPVKQYIRHRTFAVTTASITLGVIALSGGTILLIRAVQIIILIIPLLLVVLAYFFTMHKRYTTIQRSIIGFFGITLVTPLTIYSTDTSVSLEYIFALWVFSILFFCSSAFCVSIRVSHGKHSIQALLYHIAALTICYIAAEYASLPHSALIAFTVPTLRVLLVVLFRASYIGLPIKYIGIQESVVALIGVTASALYRF